MGLFDWKWRKGYMNNEAIAERFNRLANLMEIRGDDRYRIRSYRNAAEIIETWPTSMKTIVAEAGTKGLQEIPGVGRAISAKIIELLTRGTFEAWEKLITETPATTLDLLRVGGIGLKTASTLHQQFKIASIDDLKKFVAGGGLEMVDGVGEKSAERIRESLQRL
jgi:DNA polymerase (family 10)